MSLQLAAQHMASRGRGPDTQLVHMAPQEVAGLQALAKAHGGSLTVNPETGLAEAGFLKNLLPTLIGAGLSIASGGTLTPLMAAGITGAGYGVATGSLQKGLMAGLGAYGGAGLAGGLTAAAGTIGAEAGATGLTPTGGVLGANPMVAQPMTFGAEAASGMGTNVLGSTPLAGPMSAPVTTGQLAAGVPQVATATPLPSMTPVADRFSQAFQGVKNLGTEAGREAFMGNAASKGVAASGVGGGMGLMKSAYAAATPLMMQDPAKQGQKEEEKPSEFDFDFGRISDPGAGYTGAPTGERKYFNPRFTRRAADGGLMDLGTVQSMSDRNMAQTMAANGGQGFAFGGATRGFGRSIQKIFDGLRDIPEKRESRYVVDDPITTMPVTPSPVTPMPGITSTMRPVEENPYYTMSGQSGDAFKYLMGQTPTPKAAAQEPSANTSGGTGFLAGITGIAGPDGITNVNTGITTPWSASNPKPTGGGFFSDPNGAGPAGDTVEYDYTFDPVTNRYSRIAKPIDPVAAPMPSDPNAGGGGGGSGGDGYGYGYGYGGGDGGGVGGVGGAGGPGSTSAANSSDFGGDGVTGGDTGGDTGGTDGGTGATGGDGTGSGADAGSTGDCVDPAVLIMLGDKTYIPAGSIKVGDVLFTMHEGTHEFGLYPVEHAEEVQQPKAVVAFHDGATMTTSHSHKFFMTSGSWKQVYQLDVGDVVKAAPGETDKTVTAVTPVSDGPVMKITVKDAHTYISEGLISHNMKARGGRVRQRYNLGGHTVGGGLSALAMAQGGQTQYNLGGYSDGGRLLKGPGDGVSDSIPATIGNRQPARLADGEFVVPARIVSELGNGSTEAGARKLYAMMDRVQKARKKSIGKNRVAVNSRSEKMLPA